MNNLATLTIDANGCFVLSPPTDTSEDFGDRRWYFARRVDARAFASRRGWMVDDLTVA